MATINISRMKPTAEALRGCEKQLTRIADALERFLAEAYGVRTGAKADTSGDEPEVFYTSEEKDWEREFRERLKGEEAETE